MARRRYANADENTQLQNFRAILRWRKERKHKIKDFSYTVPVVAEPEIEYLRSNRSEASITWIGHSTFLLQTGGLNLLTDPVWANRMATMKRLTPPGIRLSDLPDIDVVLISHSHYDHLHYRSIRRLPGNPLYLVPAGLGGAFRRRGLTPVHELNWWDSCLHAGQRFTFVPAQHWSRRTPWDTNRSHWGGWVVSPDRSDDPDCSSAEQASEARSKWPVLYYAGDSGYFAGFQEIGRRFPIDYALLPIGAYEPEWFMRMQHVSPEEAVQAFEDLGAAKFVPMHYGAFRLADDTPKEALDRLMAEWKRRRLVPERLCLLKIGETLRA
jgi:L-ascorbate metabolism protein UlaG (beta-lactamase superfamily)